MGAEKEIRVLLVMLDTWESLELLDLRLLQNCVFIPKKIMFVIDRVLLVKQVHWGQLETEEREE